MTTSLKRRSALGLLALLPVAAAAADKPPALVGPQFADSGRCGGGSWFFVENRSPAEILEIYVRASGETGNWGEDRLGDAVLPPGRQVRLDPGPGTYDVLLLRADGQAALAMRQSSCGIEAVRLESDGRVTIRHAGGRPAGQPG